MTALYVPPTDEADHKKQNQSLQLIGGVTSTNTTNIATNTAAIAAAVATIPAVATQANQETATSLVTFVSPGRAQFHPSSAKAWAYVTQSAGTYTLAANYNIASISKTGTGVVQVNLTTAMSSTTYAVIANTTGAQSIVQANSTINSASQVTISIIRSSTEALTDSGFSVVFFGDQ